MRELVKLRRGWGWSFIALPRPLLPSEVSLLGLSTLTADRVIPTAQRSLLFSGSCCRCSRRRR